MTGPVQQIGDGEFQVEQEWLEMVESLPASSTLVSAIVDRKPVRDPVPVPIGEIDDRHLVWLFGCLVGQMSLLLGRSLDIDRADAHVAAVCQVLVDRERERRDHPLQVVAFPLSKEVDDDRPLMDASTFCDHPVSDGGGDGVMVPCGLDKGHEGDHA